MIEIINELPENVVGFRATGKVTKVAIVSHYDAIKKITNFFGHLVPGKYKGFQDSEIETAKTWVAEP